MTASRILACVLLALGVARAPRAEDVALHRSIPGTGISLEVPPGFAVSQDFPGIGHPADLTSVMVTELEVPLEIANETFAPDALERRGIEALRSEPLQLDGRAATLVHATQRIGGMTFRKWFLLFGDETHSVLLTATTPVESEEQYAELLVGVLRSMHAGPAGSAAAAPSLPFRVKEAPPLRIVRSAEASVVLSEPEAAAGRVAAVVTVGASRAQVAIDDLAAFARERLEQTVSVHEIAVASQGPRTLGGLPAHRIAASALDTETGRKVEVRQLLAHDATRYYLVQGIFDAEDAARLEPAFDAIAASFAPAGAAATP